MKAEEIPVSTRRHIETFRETITPRTQEEVPSILSALVDLSRTGAVTGRIQANLVNGGVRSIDVERTSEKVEREKKN